MNLNIKEITDELFHHVDENVVIHVLDMLTSAAFQKEKQEVINRKLKPHEEVQELATLQQEQNKKIAARCTELLIPCLQKIVPDAAVWLKGEKHTGDKLFWVVSPFEYLVLAPATISIALQEKDELLLGVLVIINIYYDGNIYIITGEKNNGSWNDAEQYKVNDHSLSEKAMGMRIIPEGKKLLPIHTEKLLSFRRGWNIPTLVNNLTQNAADYIIDVASGHADFCLGLDFAYHDIAAAICIVEQAGGIVTDFEGGKEGLYSGNSFFCSNPKIHAAFIAGKPVETDRK